MRIVVSGKQVDLSDALRTRVGNHLGVIASKYFQNAMEAHVTFGRERSFFTCDIELHAGHDKFYRARSEATLANSAFDAAADNVGTQLRRFRRRVSDHRRSERQEVLN